MTTAAIVDSLQSLQAAVADFLKHAETGGLGMLTEQEFTDAARDLETIRRQLATADYPVISEVQSRSLPEQELTRTPAGYLSKLWRLTPHEACARVREATALSPRAALTGDVLEPLRPIAAQARTAGVLSASQASLIVKTLHELPTDLPVEDVDSAEAILVQAAHSMHTGDLAKVARHLRDAIDPDGQEPSEHEQQRRRELWFRPGPDGMTRFGGTLDAATAAKAEAWFGAMAKPRPSDATGPDERSAGQRRHDAFGELLNLALRADEYATSAGSPVTVHLSLTAEQFTTGTGHAATSHGQHIRVPEALRMMDQACIAWAIHNSTGGIINFGRTRRLASRDQTEALLLRDGGCAFPACDYPMEWCERHHITEWQHGGRTDLDNLVLLCAYHHARFQQQGWRITMRDKVPWFIPPPLIDPNQTPIRNTRGRGANPFDP